MEKNIWTIFYNEKPSKIKILSHNKEFIEEIVSKSLDYIKEGLFLDIGSGNNIYSNYFKNVKYIGLDIYPFKRKNFICGLNEKLPFKKNKFQTVFSILVLEYIKEKEKALNEIHRVLKKDGYLIIVAPNSKSLPIILGWKVLIPLLNPIVKGLNAKYYPFNIKKFIKLAEKSNFKLIKKSYIPYTYFILPKFLRPLFKKIGRILKEEAFLIFQRVD